MDSDRCFLARLGRAGAQAVSTLAGICLWTTAALAQTFQFASTTYQTTEAQGYVDVVVTISEPSEFYVGCLYETAPGSALEGPDFVHEDGFLSWPSGDTTPKTIHVVVHPDDPVEDPETFTVTLTGTDGGSLGDPTVTTVTILDGEGGGGELHAVIDVGDAVPNGEGDYVLFGEQGTDVSVRVLLDHLPPAPVTVSWTSEYPPFGGTLEFDGVTERSFTVSPPASALPLTQGAVSITEPTSREIPIHGVQLAAVGGGFLDDAECVYCFVNCLLCHFGIIECDCDACFGPPPPVSRSPAAGGNPLVVLQRYRDEVLAKTPEGQYYTQLYETLSPEFARALVEEPTFLFRILGATDDWVAAIGALVDGQGAGAPITPAMEASLNAILDELADRGSAGLASTIELERTRLHLDEIEGLTMDGFQQQVEDLGGTPTSETSWGQLKELYR